MPFMRNDLESEECTKYQLQFAWTTISAIIDILEDLYKCIANDYEDWWGRHEINRKFET